MEEYKSNSHKSKEEPVPERKVEKVIAGIAKTKKQSDFQKIAKLFLPEDVSNVKSYILFDIVVPLIKKALSDTVDAILYPNGDGRSKKSSPASKISYQGYYDRHDDRCRQTERRQTGGYSYDEVVVDTRGEAESILSGMDELISNYGTASIGDLYDLAGITGNYTDNNYGWSDIRSAGVVNVRDGYMLRFPKAFPLNR